MAVLTGYQEWSCSAYLEILEFNVMIFFKSSLEHNKTQLLASSQIISYFVYKINLE